MLSAAEARKIEPVKRPVGADEIELAIRRQASASGMKVLGSGDFDHRPLLSDALNELEQGGYKIEVRSAYNWTIRW